MSLALILALVATADTKGWETKKFSQLGKEKFSFEAKVKVPPKSKTSSIPTTSGGKKDGTVAYVEVPAGPRVVLMERGPKEDKDPARLEALLAKTGTVTVSRKDPTGYWLVIERKDGIVVQGANWAVEPGVDCGTEQVLAPEQVDVVDAICSSFSK